jgi:acetyl esterase/lipase
VSSSTGRLAGDNFHKHHAFHEPMKTSSHSSEIKVPSSFQEAIVAAPKTIPLWPNNAPGSLGTADEDQPTITYYPPVNPNGAAVIVMPGGGYSLVASNHEGRQIANWLNALGVTAFVLKYRIGPRYHHPIELGDAQRSVRLVRFRAAHFGLDPKRIGVMGFSAGGHLASSVSTHFDSGNPIALDPVDRIDCRPDFAILAYAVISFQAPLAHAGSVVSLLGNRPGPSLLLDLSNERHVTPRTPPTFLFATGEDDAVPPENSLVYFEALRKAGVQAEIHIFGKGPHGVGLALHDRALSKWPELLKNWMVGLALLPNE